MHGWVLRLRLTVGMINVMGAVMEKQVRMWAAAKGFVIPRSPTSPWRVSDVALIAHGILHFTRRLIPSPMESTGADKGGWAIKAIHESR